MTMTVAKAAKRLKTDAQTFIINAMERFPEAEVWTADTELPEEMVQALELHADEYKEASSPNQSVQAGSNFNGSLVKSTGDAIEQTRLCAEALQFALHEIDPRELEEWIAAATMAAVSKIEVYEAVHTDVLSRWREGQITRSSANLEKCLAGNQDKVNAVLQKYGIPTASESLGNSMRHQAAAAEQTSKILEQVLKVSAKTR